MLSGKSTSICGGGGGGGVFTKVVFVILEILNIICFTGFGTSATVKKLTFGLIKRIYTFCFPFI